MAPLADRARVLRRHGLEPDGIAAVLGVEVADVVASHNDPSYQIPEGEFAGLTGPITWGDPADIILERVVDGGYRNAQFSFPDHSGDLIVKGGGVWSTPDPTTWPTWAGVQPQGFVEVTAANATDTVWHSNYAGAGEWKFVIDASGKLQWSDDTILRRRNTGQLEVALSSVAVNGGEADLFIATAGAGTYVDQYAASGGDWGQYAGAIWAAGPPYPGNQFASIAVGTPGAAADTPLFYSAWDPAQPVAGKVFRSVKLPNYSLSAFAIGIMGDLAWGTGAVAADSGFKRMNPGEFVLGGIGTGYGALQISDQAISGVEYNYIDITGMYLGGVPWPGTYAGFDRSGVHIGPADGLSAVDTHLQRAAAGILENPTHGGGLRLYEADGTPRTLTVAGGVLVVT